jgi:peptide chain release factor 2
MMMGRLYTSYAERNGYEYSVINEVAGEEAGYKTYSLEIKGAYAYGFLKGESGVHRLVRISPFDSGARRHTSFTSVDVVPSIEDEIEIEVLDKDLEISTFRASGAGGQHVNKTDSAVRMVHIPSGVVATCQQERSQLQNKVKALSMLKAKLYQLELLKREEATRKLYDAKGEIAWGNQIRSYVLQPYQLIRDERTGEETSNIQNILDGEIDSFIEAFILGKKRKKG